MSGSEVSAAFCSRSNLVYWVCLRPSISIQGAMEKPYFIKDQAMG